MELLIKSRRVSFIFTPLESPTIYGGHNIDRISIPYIKGGNKAPSFLTGFTQLYCDSFQL
jgi:hypothetical protein